MSLAKGARVRALPSLHLRLTAMPRPTQIERFVLSLMMDMADAKRRLSPEELRYAEK